MNNENTCTFGILYTGDMGSALGKLLSERYRVITTLEGRGQRTRARCNAADLTIMSTSLEVVQNSDVIISLVTPSAALELAQEVANLAKSSNRPLLYVDANSISPMVARSIASRLSSAHVDFLDASIHGIASRLKERGVLYVSGAKACEFAELIRGLMCVNVLGTTPGQASALKMVLAGISKGLIALFLETMVFASQLQLLPEALDGCERFYPGIMDAIRRMLPTYVEHSVRRSAEVGEIEQSMMLSGLEAHVVTGVRQVMASLNNIRWPEDFKDGHPSVPDIVQEVFRQGLLQAARLDGGTHSASALKHDAGRRV